MDEQGGAGGVPLHHGQAHDRHAPRGDRRDDGKTAAADTDEASRLDRPQQPEKPRGKGTRWVSPRDD
ncbi:hypothetical protein ABT237_33275 [Streptomyces sp. NPDC001581]|uniref:hypothetical protein n=1 Tax=Streptomyces sp. NPDC001581 TaxID=3154386 RepID=UPI0033207B4D